jgi:carboxynorspermidine decarboxylase
MFTLWPDFEERRLLGRFYIANTLSETFNVIWPFQFAYLFMVMERPEWAVSPLIAESGMMLLMQIPTGIWADRHSRRSAVIFGNLINAIALALVPFAAQQTGQMQLLAIIGCFGLWGFGQALVAGANNAWVVDNLIIAERYELVDNYFARINSFASLGAVAAGATALVLLITLDVSRTILDSLWYIAAFGFLLCLFIQLGISEQRPVTASSSGTNATPSWISTLSLGLRALRRSKTLLFFGIALVVASFPESVTDDAFDMSLITKGMDARGLAPLGIIDNIIAMTAPLIGLALVRRFGVTHILVWFLLLPALTVSTLFISSYLWLVIVLYVLLDFFDAVWDPVAAAHLQSLLSSDTRATVASIVDHAGGLMELLGIAAFAWMLGEYNEQLSEIVPDLLTAFSGGEQAVADVPVAQFGLAIPDLVIVVFILSALLALPFILLSSRHGARRGSNELPLTQQDRTDILQTGALKTPAFVTDITTLKEDIQATKTLACDEHTKLLFAMKSYSTLAGLEVIAEKVSGFAASSLYEAKLARELMGKHGSVHLTTPGLRTDEIKAIGELVDYLSFNSLTQWYRYKDIMSNKVSCGLRVNPQLSFVEDERYDPCRQHSKLGVPLDQLQALILHSPEKLHGIKGLHIHSNCDARDLTPLLRTTERLLEVLSPLREQIQWINLGGGYLLNNPLHSEALQDVKSRLQQLGDYQLFIEPGAAIVRRAGYIVSSVVDLFYSSQQHIAVLDTSVNHMPEVFEYQFEPDVLGDIWSDDAKAQHQYLLAGSACLAGDLFGEYAFAQPLDIGSRIIFPNIGAYSMVKANMFNGINLPTLYTLSENGVLNEVTRFSYRDFRRLCGD